MADQKVTELPIKNQSAINVADYLFGIDAAEGYQMLISDLAKKIIEDFTGSTLGGSSQALKTIIDAINTKIGNTAMGTTATTITGAIKEHETDISTLNGKFHYVDYAFNYSQPSGGTVGERSGQYTLDDNYPNETVVSVTLWQPQNTDRVNPSVSYNSGTKKIYCNIYRATTGGSTGTVSARVLYMK